MTRIKVNNMPRAKRWPYKAKQARDKTLEQAQIVLGKVERIEYQLVENPMGPNLELVRVFNAQMGQAAASIVQEMTRVGQEQGNDQGINGQAWHRWLEALLHLVRTEADYEAIAGLIQVKLEELQS
jgi:hypothetical protein